MEKLSIFIRGEAFLADISRRYERVERKVLTIERSTQKKLVQDGRRSKQFTLQMYEKQRVRTSSRGILFPYRPKQKHADARGIGVSGKKRAERGRPTPLGGGGVREERGGSASGGGR